MKHVRHQKIYNILKSLDEEHAMSLTELHRELESSGFNLARKTVERDIALMDKSYKLLETDTHPARYYTDNNFTPDYQLSFNEGQLQTIILALDNLKQTSPKAIQDICRGVEVALNTKLPDSLSAELEQYKKLHHISYGVNGRAKAKCNKSFSLALECLREGVSFKCNYFSPYNENKNQGRVRNFSPIKLLISGGTYYLFVRDLDDDNQMIKSLRMTRLTKLEKTKVEVQPLQKNELNHIDSFYGGMYAKEKDLINYEIIGTEILATYFEEREIHSSQKIAKINNETYKVTFKLPYSYEVVRVLAGFYDQIIEVNPIIISEELDKITCQQES